MIRNLFVAVLAVVCAGAFAHPVSAQTSTVFDPVGDMLFPFNAPFQDFVRGQLTKTAGGDFHLLMEMAALVPLAPPLPPQGGSEIWWFWIFDLDPTIQPRGYPWQNAVGRPPEFIVYVSWDGSTFAGNAIDRRSLLTGGEAIITPVTFSTNGTIVEAILPAAVIGAVPASFPWGAFTSNWSGPVGSEGFNFADYQEAMAVFNPPAVASAVDQPDQTSTILDPVGDAIFNNAPPFQDIVFAQLTKTPDGDLELLTELAGPVPVNPPLPPQGHTEIWWAWSFDLDPNTFPQGYPFTAHSGRIPEFNVYVRWDGAEFAGIAVDRRPLLTGGEAIITSVTFNIDDTVVTAVLPYEQIGDVPASFRWAASTDDWPGPVGTASHFYVDLAIFDPPAVASAVDQPEQTNTIFDSLGDGLYNAPAFQDFVFGQLTMTAAGDFEMLMELAGPVPANPTLPPHGQSEIWWAWAFDLDPAASPRGYPSAPNTPAAPEYIVYVSWNGEEFAGTAIDRRPLLIGGEAIVNPVEFSIDDTVVEAVLPSDLIDDFPTSFEWRLRTIDYSGPVGSAGWRPVDLAQAIFNP